VRVAAMLAVSILPALYAYAVLLPGDLSTDRPPRCGQPNRARKASPARESRYRGQGDASRQGSWDRSR
jgi:hypothetical protein